MGLRSAVASLHLVTHTLLPLQRTHALRAVLNMEWEEDSFGKSQDDTLQFYTPESFFEPWLENLDSFPKNLLDSTCDYSKEILFVKPWNDNEELSELLNSTFEDTLLSVGPVSPGLTSDEIFSQIEICSDFLEDSNHTIVGDYPHPSLEDIEIDNYTRDDTPSIDIKEEVIEDEEEKVETEPVKTESCPDDVNFNFEKIQSDIAKLKKEVDFTSDDDSLWSDFFSEEDTFEISTEYENHLQSLLITPVEDFNLSLNVFNNVEEHEEADEAAAKAAQAAADERRKYCIDHIKADHCYSLPWETMSVLLTPPTSSDDSEGESESSSQEYIQSNKISVKSETPKFIQKTVKLKHKKDLKFVFSMNVKDQLTAAGQTVPGRSLLKKNQLPEYNPTRDLVQEVLNRRAYRKRQKVNEAALAVETLLSTENRKSVLTEKLVKVQSERENHNSMERQRRIELKNEFDTLKSLIPDIALSEKVSKLNVLNYSADYVKKLERMDIKLKLKKNLLKEKRQKLLEELKRMR